MDSMPGYLIRPALPAQGVAVEVPCRSVPGARAKPHTVTVTREWELITPHDLEVERIAVALGGALSCVELADRILPAARGLLEHLNRVVPADIERQGRGWRVGVPAEGCGCETTFATAKEAARHLRDVRHWARLYQVRPTSVERLAVELRLGRPLEDPRCPLPHGAAEAYLVEPEALDELWDAGVHFGLVPDMARTLSPSGEPIPAHIVVAHAYVPDEFARLEPFVAHGPLVLAWASRTWTSRDRRRPGDRLAWVEAGLPLPAIADAFQGDAYTLDHVRAYAAATGASPAMAARTLGRWQAAMARPPAVADLVELSREALMTDVPPPAAVGRVIGLAAGRGLQVDEARAALALAAAGNVPDAVARLRAGGRDEPLFDHTEPHRTRETA